MVSFDIFDTLITRSTYTPQGIFNIVQEKLCAMSKNGVLGLEIDNHFLQNRIAAEQDAGRICQKKDSEEITFLEIYKSFKRMTGISDELMHQIMAIEEQTEVENVVPIKDNIQLLKKYLKEGEEVILISDMYLPVSIIQRMLGKVEPILGSLELYVSSEIGKKKETGSLYVFIKRKKKISYKDWVHYGDNYKSDIEKAALWGIKAIQLKSNSKIADITNRFTTSLNIDEQLFLGTIKNLNIEKELNSNQLIGAFWGGGLLYSYVSWIIQYSLKHDFYVLYFISRDGYVLKKIADIIIAENHYVISTKYLFGSRKAWRENEAEKLQLMQEYFEQEVNFEDKNFAFVDLQGTGTSILNVKKILEKHFVLKQLNIFYFQMFYCPNIDGCNFIIYSYLSNIALIELFARAPHGMVEGYKKQGEKVVPALASVKEEIWKQHGLFDYIDGVCMFAHKYTLSLKKNGMTGVSRELTSFLGKEFDRFLNKQELQFICEMPHNSTLDDEYSVMAPMLSWKKIFEIYMWRTIEPVSSFYQEGDLHLSLRRLNESKQKYIKKLEKAYYGWIGRLIHRAKHMFMPKIDLGKNRYIVYAAGNKGKEIVAKITYQTNGKVVGWTDSSYLKYKKIGYPVVSLSECLKKDYDKVIIALENHFFCVEIKEYLMELGVEESRIMFYADFAYVLRTI